MTEAHLIRGGGGQGIALICLHMWSQKLPETLSDIINFKIFLGEHPQITLIGVVTVVP